MNFVLRGLHVTLVMGLILLVLLMFYLFSKTTENYRALTKAQNSHFQAQELIQSLYQSSATLTRLARTYAVTGDRRFEQLFERVLEVRRGGEGVPQDNALLYWDFMSVQNTKTPTTFSHKQTFDDLIEMTIPTQEERQSLSQARALSDALAVYEAQQMSAVPPHPDIPPYVAGLFNEDYHQRKLMIMKDLQAAFSGIDDRMHAEVARAHAKITQTKRIHFIAFCLSILLGFTLLMVLYISQRRTIRELKARVKRRTAHLDASLKELQDAHDQIKTLQGLIPICAYCHKIRNDAGIWDRLEVYLSKHSDAKLSHGVCPSCMDVAFPELDEKP